MDDSQITAGSGGDGQLLPIGRSPSYGELRQLESAIASQCEPVDCPVTHHWADGIYGREMFIPAGTVLTGKIHRFSTLNFLMQGEITVTTPDGMRRISAPAIFTSDPGCKKAGYAHTDVVWVNVHPTKLRDVDAIESKFIEPEAPVLISSEEVPCLGEQ